MEIIAITSVVIDKATALENQCRKAMKKLAGVSTPAVPNGADDMKLKAIVLAKRHAKRLRKTIDSQSNAL